MSAQTPKPLKRLALICLLPAALAAGCAAADARYMKPGESNAKIDDELKSCRADSQEAMSDGKQNAARQRGEQSQLIDQCMKAKGFSRASSP